MDTRFAKDGASGPVLVSVLDDDDAVRNLVLIMLGRMGCSATGFSRGEDLLAACAADFPDLVVLDIQVADGMGGLDCLRALRAAGYVAPAIAMTGLAGSGGQYPEGGEFSAVVGKPFTMNELESAIRSVLGGEGSHG